MAPESIESRTEENKSKPEVELKDLERQLRDLEIVQRSLRMESDSEFEIAREVEKSELAVEEASSSLVAAEASKKAEQGLQTDNERVALAKAREHRKGMQGWQSAYGENHSVNYESYGKLEEGPLADKLRSLGIDVDALSKGPYAGSQHHWGGLVESAIAARSSELEKQIQEKRLEVPGGKEEMVAEVLRHGNYEKAVAEVREKLRNPFHNPLTIGGLFEKMDPLMDKARWHPNEVKHGVAYQALREAITGGDKKYQEAAARREESAQKLAELKDELQIVREMSARFAIARIDGDRIRFSVGRFSKEGESLTAPGESPALPVGNLKGQDEGTELQSTELVKQLEAMVKFEDAEVQNCTEEMERTTQKVSKIGEAMNAYIDALDATSVDAEESFQMRRKFEEAEQVIGEYERARELALSNSEPGEEVMIKNGWVVKEGAPEAMNMIMFPEWTRKRIIASVPAGVTMSVEEFFSLADKAFESERETMREFTAREQEQKRLEEEAWRLSNVRLNEELEVENPK